MKNQLIILKLFHNYSHYISYYLYVHEKKDYKVENVKADAIG
jgi:hypothetical protein